MHGPRTLLALWSLKQNSFWLITGFGVHNLVCNSVLRDEVLYTKNKNDVHLTANDNRSQALEKRNGWASDNVITSATESSGRAVL